MTLLERLKVKDQNENNKLLDSPADKPFTCIEKNLKLLKLIQTLILITYYCFNRENHLIKLKIKFYKLHL